MNWAATTMASTHQRQDESICLVTIWCIGARLWNLSVLRISDRTGYRDYLAGKDAARMTAFRRTGHRAIAFVP